MTNFARVINDVAVDVSTDPTNQFHPDIAAQFESVPDEVQHGWVRTDGEWEAPAPVPVPEPEPEPEPAPEQTQFEKDQSRYQKRAAVKDELFAYMAADNMGRVRSGVWTVADLTALLDDPAVTAANALMGTLSFELAAEQISAATTALLTPEIKADWVSRLHAHYYLEG